MKKRRILFGCLIAAASLVLSACDFLPENLFSFPRKEESSQQSSERTRPSRTPSSSNNTHVHKFSEEWSYNTSAHWHNAICGHDVKSEMGQHTYYSAVIKQPTCNSEGEQVDICTICDYRRTTVLPRTDHSWREYSRVEPTCNEQGYVRRYCTTCGLSEEMYLDPLGHDFVTIEEKPSTCSEEGYTVLQCQRCNEIFNYVTPKSNHNWTGNEYYHQGEGENVSYSIDTCRDCGATKVKIWARDGKLMSGSFKTGAAYDYGYMKFNSNGSSISYTFDYPNTAYGTLYQHGVFDQNPGQYDSYNYKTGNNNGGYNFEMTMNGQIIDLSQSSQISYGEFFNGGQEVEGLTYNGYSFAGDCLVGDVCLAQGLNTMTYSRIASYNIWVDYFILIVQNSNHQHTVSSRWNCDEDSHWHVCEDPNCPVSGARIDNSAHLFGERYVAYAANCHSEGLEYEICQICGYQRNYYIPATDHDYQPVGGFEKVDDSVYLEEYGCQYCDQYVLRWDAMEYDQNLSQGVDLYSGSAIRFKSGMVENQGGTIQTGAHVIYKLNIPTYLANVGLAFNMSQSNSTSSRVFYSSSGQGYIFDDNGNLVQTTTKYGLRINGQEIRLGDDYYDYVSNSNINWYNWPVKFDLVAGENTIDIYCLDSNYRARIYDFQITGVPYIAPTHIHEAANYLEYDGYTHYNPCTNNDGVRFNEEPHVFGEYVTISDPTCTEYGQQMRTCSVCGYEEYTSLYPHGHNYEQYYTIQEPTCTQEGIQESTCTICGVTEQWIISPYGHQWDEGVVTVEPTHTVPGEKLYTCLVCGEQKVENIPAGHNWGDATYIGPANEGQVGYNKRVCQDDGTIEIDIRAMDATLYEGGLKYLNSDYVRLANNGTSMSYTFNFDQHVMGRLYIRGTLNSYSSNQSRPFAFTDTTYSSPSFEMMVNSQVVDMSQNMGVTFYNYLQNGYVDPNLSSSYSPVANCYVGDIELNPGENIITYTRLGSYNLYLSDIILEVSPTNHTHTPQSGYACDENYHWHYCSDPNCPFPNTALNKEPHNYVPVEGQEIGCYGDNSILYVCTECGYQRGYTSYNDHNFDVGTMYATNSDGYEVMIRNCATCGKTVQSMYFNQGLVLTGSYSGGKLQSGTTMKWKMPVYQSGWISIYIPCKMSSGNTNQTYDPSLYAITVNSLGLNILMPSGTYDELGITSTETKYYKWAEYYVSQDDVLNGEIEINFTSNVSSYRMIFDGEIRIEF